MSRGGSGVGQSGVTERRQRGEREGGKQTTPFESNTPSGSCNHISAGGEDDCFHLMSFILLKAQKPKNNAVSSLFCALKSFFTHRDS